MNADKKALLTRISTLRRELDEIVDMVIALEEAQPITFSQNQNSDTEKLLTVKQVCKVLQISDSTFYEHLRSGLLPPGISFGPRSKRWRISDIEKWQEEKRESKSKLNIVIPETVKRRGRSSKVRKKVNVF